MDGAAQLQCLGESVGVRRFAAALAQAGLHPLRSQRIEILQMNITNRCNLSCRHCHIQAGPQRTAEMSRAVLEKCLNVAALPGITTIDITGGAPELHPRLRWFLEQAARLRKRLIVRSNLVVLLDNEHRDLVDCYARSGVELVASLPDPGRVRTDRQRGEGAFSRIIEAMQLLNERGYGVGGSPLMLDLVHNPAGAFLAGPQNSLEEEYRRKLCAHGVSFSRLFCLNNCPIGRYLEYLVSSDNLNEYLEQLAAGFNPVAAENVMCRSTLSVGWNGGLYDCDFNQALALGVDSDAPGHILDFDLDRLAHRTIRFDNHCFVCTAGAGSSCQGATA